MWVNIRAAIWAHETISYRGIFFVHVLSSKVFYILSFFGVTLILNLIKSLPFIFHLINYTICNFITVWISLSLSIDRVCVCFTLMHQRKLVLNKFIADQLTVYFRKFLAPCNALYHREPATMRTTLRITMLYN